RFVIGRQPFTHARHLQRFRRVVAPLRPADGLITGAYCKKDFGERRKQRDDPLRRRSIVPTCRRVAGRNEEYGDEESSQHHPSREGTNGGANEDVSWLRAKRGVFPGIVPVTGPRL